MNEQTAVFHAIREAYAIEPHGPPRQISERVWQLPDGGTGVAVKLYPPEHRGRAQKESTLLAHLNTCTDHRFRVQRLRQTRDGKPLWDSPGPLAMVTLWQAGQCRTYDTFTTNEWAALGSSLAALHLSLDSLSLPGLDSIQSRLANLNLDDARQNLIEIRHHGCNHGTSDPKLNAYVDNGLRMLDEHYRGSIDAFPADDPQRPIHNDYNQFNYLFDGTLPPFILDWEAAIGAPREYEVVRCLNHLPLQAPILAQQFVHGYLKVRPLNGDHLAWAVDAACLQHTLKHWVWQGWLKDPSRFEPHLQGAMTLVSALSGKRRHLIDFFHHCLQMQA